MAGTEAGGTGGAAEGPDPSGSRRPGRGQPIERGKPIERGTPEFRRTVVAMLCAGFATFALMYCVQPLLPEFARDFRVSAASSSLALSLTTGFLSVSMLVASALSEARGRKPLMVGSILLAALLTIGSAFVPGWHAFLALRALEGIAFAGLPALAMAYLGEELEAESVGLAMGLYVGGTGIGGMTGRLLTSALTDLVSWRFAIGAIGVLGLAAGLVFWRALPPSRRFVPATPGVRRLLGGFGEHLRDGDMLKLFATGFLLLGSFVALYNYVGFRLMAAPYRLSQTAVGLIFVLYLAGVGSSGWIGALMGRVGRDRLLLGSVAAMAAGTAVTLLRPLAFIVLGIALLTVGFFGAQAVVSSWVAVRARRGRAQAAALYMLFYYLGSSVAGYAAGIFWADWGWPGVVGFVGGLLLLALLLVRRVPRGLEPPGAEATPSLPAA